MSVALPYLTILRQWLLEANYAPILESAENKNGILSLLTALTYDKDVKISDHAIEATGLAARIIASRDPEYVRNYLLRLFWLVNDESGGICWRAPELIGEILHHCPQFSQFFPMLISLLDLEEEDAPRFRAGTLWAIGRVAQVAKDAMLPALSRVHAIASGDKSTNEAMKEKAMWCMGQLTADVPFV
jgi:AraC family transcriptional regulator of adaptative response/methylated-DNA-[protein]-cysteine methyltransferase